VWFRDCKRILQDSGNLKRVAWGLNAGTGCGRTSIKTEFALSLPLNFYIYYYLSFALRKIILNYLTVIHNKSALKFSLKKIKIYNWGNSLWYLNSTNPPPLLKISEATCPTSGIKASFLYKV